MCSTSPPAPDGHRAGGDLRPRLLAALLVVGTVALFLGSTHERAGVWLAAPLDDSFIHFQYAKQLARLHPFQYQDGDAPSTGATSLLYQLVLAPGWLLGFRGIYLLVWAWLVNAGLHLVGGLALFATVQRLAGRRALAYTAMTAFLLCGPLLWGAYSQMEVALFSTLILLTLLEAVRLAGDEPGALRRLLLWGVGLGLVRPEGMLMAGGLTLWLLWRHPGSTWRARLGGGRTLLPLLAGVAVVLLWTALTGRLSTNAAVKSHVIHAAKNPLWYARVSAEWLPMTPWILLEKWPVPLRLPVAVLGGGGLLLWAWQDLRRRRGPGVLALGWLILLVLFYAAVMARRFHFDRYYLPYVGLTVVACWWALGWLARRWPRWARVPVVLGGLAALAMLPGTFEWAARYGDSCRDLSHQHFRAVRWMREHIPSRGRVALNDAGALVYLGKHYAYDLVGLVHNDFFRRWSHMPYFMNAPVWETLESLPRRPDYLVVYPHWFPDLEGLPVLVPLARFHLDRPTVAGGDTKVISRVRWDRIRDGNVLPAAVLDGRQVVDRLDVADLASEAAHGYSRLSSGWPHGLVGQVGRGGQVLLDGGRHITRGEAFVLRSRPGSDAVLVLRTAGPRRLELEVTVEGRPAGRWRARPTPGLAPVTFAIPAKLVRRDRTHLQLRARRPYRSFHYWLLQR